MKKYFYSALLLFLLFFTSYQLEASASIQDIYNCIGLDSIVIDPSCNNSFQTPNIPVDYSPSAPESNGPESNGPESKGPESNGPGSKGPDERGDNESKKTTILVTSKISLNLPLSALLNEKRTLDQIVKAFFPEGLNGKIITYLEIAESLEEYHRLNSINIRIENGFTVTGDPKRYFCKNFKNDMPPFIARNSPFDQNTTLINQRLWKIFCTNSESAQDEIIANIIKYYVDKKGEEFREIFNNYIDEMIDNSRLTDDRLKYIRSNNDSQITIDEDNFMPRPPKNKIRAVLTGEITGPIDLIPNFESLTRIFDIHYTPNQFFNYKYNEILSKFLLLS
ncbi:MAG: hypothetical protein RLZZ361_1213 [Cyanobacteriota bacterium]